jgi:F-type H+-transporting ATPase subunit b
MLIDWFTVSAQVGNFLILVWLLRRYLYRPVLAAIDAREHDIAAKLKFVQDEREKLERDKKETAAQRETLEQNRHAMIIAAEQEAKSETTRLLAAAEAEMVAQRKANRHELEVEALNYHDELIRLTRSEIVACVRKALGDLASASLEQTSAEVLLQRLDAMPSTPLQDGHAGVRLRCAFPLSQTVQEKIGEELRRKFGFDHPPVIEIDPDLLLGFDLTVGDSRIEWNVDSYLASFEKHLEEKGAAPVSA